MGISPARSRYCPLGSSSLLHSQAVQWQRSKVAWRLCSAQDRTIRGAVFFSSIVVVILAVVVLAAAAAAAPYESLVPEPG